MNNTINFFIKNNFFTNQKINSIDRLYELSDLQLLNNYNEAFISLIKNVYKKSSFYKNLYNSLGINISDIKSISDINKLPVINRSSIKDNADRIYFGNKFFKIKGQTSGTSGSPITVYRTPSSINIENAYIRHYREIFGFKFKERLVSIRGMLGKNVPYYYNRLNNILYISGPSINNKSIQFYYELIRDFNPTAIEAFPSYIYKFYYELNKKKLFLKFKNIFTSSEMLYSFQRDKIEKYFNSVIHDWYGNVERSICLVQNKNMQYYPLPLYSINEFKTNSIITTSLINNNFPLIRYEVEDRITVRSSDFYENIIHPEVIQIEGRSGDTIELLDGSIVGCIDHAFKGIDNLILAQVYQSISNKSLEIKLVVNKSFNHLNESKLRANLVRMIGNDIQIRFSLCDENDLILNKNRKYQLIIKND